MRRRQNTDARAHGLVLTILRSMKFGSWGRLCERSICPVYAFEDALDPLVFGISQENRSLCPSESGKDMESRTKKIAKLFSPLEN